MYGCLDRFEEDMGVIYIEDEDCIINIPKCLLPDNINEGDYLDIIFKYNAEKTAKAFKEAEDLFYK